MDNDDVKLNDSGEIEVTVWRGFKGQESEMDKEKISVRKFATAPAKVGYWSAGKVNIGNYESVDVGVSISVPCYLEEANEAYRYAEKFVSERLTKEINDIRTVVRNGEEAKMKKR